MAAPILADRKALCLLRLVERSVGRQRLLVDRHRIGKSAQPDIGVRGHVQQMWRHRRQLAEPVGGALGPLGDTHRVDRVDQVVVDAGVLRVRRRAALQLGRQLADATGRLA